MSQDILTVPVFSRFANYIGFDAPLADWFTDPLSSGDTVLTLGSGANQTLNILMSVNQTGPVDMSGNLHVGGTLTVDGSSLFNDSVEIQGGTTCGDTLTVNGDSQFNSLVRFQSETQLNGPVFLTDAFTINGGVGNYLLFDTANEDGKVFVMDRYVGLGLSFGGASDVSGAANLQRVDDFISGSITFTPDFTSSDNQRLSGGPLPVGWRPAITITVPILIYEFADLGPDYVMGRAEIGSDGIVNVYYGLTSTDGWFPIGTHFTLGDITFFYRSNF